MSEQCEDMTLRECRDCWRAQIAEREKQVGKLIHQRDDLVAETEILKAEIARLRNLCGALLLACQATLDWVGPDGHGLDDPARQLCCEALLGIENR